MMDNEPTTPAVPAITQSATRTPHLRLWIAGGVTVLVLFMCCAGAIPLGIYGALIAPTPTAAGAPGANTTSHQPTATTQPTNTATAGPTVTPQPTATATATPRPTATATLPPAPAWHNDANVSGNGDKTTETFVVPFDAQAQLLWTCNPNSSAIGQYNLIVSIYNADGSVADYGAVNTICASGNTSGSTALQGIDTWAGDEYLQILSEGSWTVKVQSFY